MLSCWLILEGITYRLNNGLDLLYYEMICCSSFYNQLKTQRQHIFIVQKIRIDARYVQT